MQLSMFQRDNEARARVNLALAAGAVTHEQLNDALDNMRVGLESYADVIDKLLPREVQHDEHR